MSEINSTPQSNPKAGEGSSLNKDIWKIWVGNHSLLSTQYHQPYWTFYPRESEISTVSQLRSELSTLDDSPPHRVRYIFCRQGVTSEQLDRNSGFGYWDNRGCEGWNIFDWKNMCELLLKYNLDHHELRVYGVIVDYSPHGQSNCFWWMANVFQEPLSVTEYTAKYVDQL